MNLFHTAYDINANEKYFGKWPILCLVVCFRILLIENALTKSDKQLFKIVLMICGEF